MEELKLVSSAGLDPDSSSWRTMIHSLCAGGVFVAERIARSACSSTSDTELFSRTLPLHSALYLFHCPHSLQHICSMCPYLHFNMTCQFHNSSKALTWSTNNGDGAHSTRRRRFECRTERAWWPTLPPIALERSLRLDDPLHAHTPKYTSCASRVRCGQCGRIIM